MSRDCAWACRSGERLSIGDGAGFSEAAGEIYERFLMDGLEGVSDRVSFETPSLDFSALAKPLNQPFSASH